MGSQSSGLPASKEYGEMLVSASMSEYRLIYCSDRVTLRKVTQLHTDRWDGQDNCSKYECESVTSSVKIFTLLRSNDDFSFGLRREHQPAQTAPAVTGLPETLRFNWCD